MVRGRDACWEHCVLVDATKQKVGCNYCRREFSGGVYRMKFHLAQIKNKDIVPCTDVPDDVRDHIRTIISTPKKQKSCKRLKVDLADNGGETSSSTSGGGIHPNQRSNGQRGSSCPSLLFPHPPSPRMQPAVDDAGRKNVDDADKKVAVFLFHNGIPFATANSMYYQEMVDAVATCGEGYKAPSFEKLKSVLMETVKGDIHDLHNKYKKDWKETGCTILCQSLYDGRSRSKCLVVFSVACPKGTLFLKSADVFGHEDDANYLFELLESVVLEVGLDSVVQVITDAADSYTYAGKLLTNKYNSLFWSPCAWNCIDKMLEGIGKQEWVAAVLEDSNSVVKYIYSNAWSLGMLRKFTSGRELIRPRIAKFAAYFLSLRSIVLLEGKLKLMFSHSEWSSSVHSRQTDAQVIKALLFEERFWESANEAVGITEPLLKLLWIVDGNMPAMGYMYEGLERAKVEIEAYYKGVQEKYFPIWDIIDRGWSIQFHSPLHAAAAFLNPLVFYSPNFKTDKRIRNGFQEAMLKMATTEADKMEITKEHPIYVNAQGALGTSFAIMGRTLNSPGDWWSAYGYEIPTLQRHALRILNQPCSSHGCNWNRTTFENAHGVKRKKWDLDKLNDLVFVHCNLWLQAIGQSRRKPCKPIVYEEIDVGLEWPTELEPATPPLDDSWLGNFFLECKASN